MSTSPEPTAVRFDEDGFWVELDDGRTLGVPLAWFPRLLAATSAQREDVRLSRTGMHWEQIDEDISVAGLLAGRGDQTMVPRRQAARRAAELNVFRLRVALSTALMPTVLCSAFCAMGLLVRGAILAPGWQWRAVESVVALYTLIVTLMLIAMTMERSKSG